MLVKAQLYAKAIAALVAALPVPAVLGVLTLCHIHIDAATWATLLGVLTPILSGAAVVKTENKVPSTLA
jgi:hypothetical protein